MKRAIASRPAGPFMMMALVRLRLHGKPTMQAFSHSMDGLPEVMTCLQLAGEFDFLLEVVLPGPQAYETFLLKKLCTIPSVEKVQSSLVLKAWKCGTLVF
jgi:Lrp/AsnC family leucine-responsive transcriptional regulator